MTLNRKFLVLGADGQLGGAFAEYFQGRAVPFAARTFAETDITDDQKIRGLIGEQQPAVVINCAAYNFVDRAEKEPEAAFEVNARAVGRLAECCNSAGAFFIHYGTDYVFDGEKNGPYTEEDAPNPINVYGKSKLAGEQETMKAGAQHLIFRLSWVFGGGENSFLNKLDRWAGEGKPLKIVDDEISVPTYTCDVVECTIRAYQRGLTGLYHLTNSGRCSRYELAEYYFSRLGGRVKIQPCKSDEFHFGTRRPLQSAMSNTKLVKALGEPIPEWKDAVDRYIESRGAEKSGVC